MSGGGRTGGGGPPSSPITASPFFSLRARRYEAAGRGRRWTVLAVLLLAGGALLAHWAAGGGALTIASRERQRAGKLLRVVPRGGGGGADDVAAPPVPLKPPYHADRDAEPDIDHDDEREPPPGEPGSLDPPKLLPPPSTLPPPPTPSLSAAASATSAAAAPSRNASLLDRFLHRVEGAAAGGGACPQPFSSVLFLIVLTHTLKKTPGERHYCQSLWKGAAAAGVQFVLLGDESVVPPKRKYDHIVKLSVTDAFFDEVAARGLLTEDTLVVTHDALDVLQEGSIEELVECLSAMYCGSGYDTAKDLIFLGERGMWPPSDAYNKENYPTVRDEDAYRYINSGLLAGPWRAVSQYVKAALSPETNNKTCSCNDQESANALFVNNASWRARMRMDSQQQCFGSAHISAQNYELRNERWYNTYTKQTPLLLHFNGGGKEWMDLAVRGVATSALMWKSTPKLLGLEVLLWGETMEGSRVMPYAQICSAYP